MNKKNMHICFLTLKKTSQVQTSLLSVALGPEHDYGQNSTGTKTN